MPSVSKSQQRLMGQAYAYKTGELKSKDLNPEYADEIKDLAKSMTKKQLKDFASTKHNKLPNKVKESKILGFQSFNESNQVLKPVIDQSDATYYVSEGSFIKFVNENSNMEWNTICDLVRDENVFNEEGRTYYDGKIEKESWNTDFGVEWINKFYDAHPFMENVMFVFDD